jgi:hypothetical protein
MALSYIKGYTPLAKLVNAIDLGSISSDSQFKSGVGYWILYPNFMRE